MTANATWRNWLAHAEQHRCDKGRPLVGLCYAQSLDGCLTLERGQPFALSGPTANRLTHRLRAAHDAILVGVGTVLADDPRLTVRMARGSHPQPVIIDSHLHTPPQAYLVSQHPRRAWIATLENSDPVRQAALEANGAHLLRLPSDPDGHVLLAALLERLAEMGISSLMVEGGAQILSAFIAAGLADWAGISLAPCFLGGLHAIEARLPNLPRLHDVAYQRAGEDMVVWGRFIQNR